MKKSFTFKNFFDNGYTTYHSDGGKSYTFPNIFTSGLTTYDIGRDAAADGLFDALYPVFAVILIVLSILSLTRLGKGAVLSILLIIISIIARAWLNSRHETTIFVLWAHPFTLLGWRLLVSYMWRHTHGNILELFGIFFISLGIIATLFLDYSDSFMGFLYGFITMIIMIFMKAFGSYAPYWMLLVMIGVAIIATPIYVSIHRKSSDE